MVEGGVYVVGGGAYLVDVVEVGTLIRPVVVALLHSSLHQGGQHHDDHTAVLPHHLQPELYLNTIKNQSYI